MSDQKILLAVLAHPDDETFGMGGTLALYARRGVDVYLICATRGEVGEMDPQFLRGFHSIAERRESELRCAAENLGLKEVFFLNYRDSGMTGSPENQHPQALINQPLDEVARNITHIIRQLKPQVVITFDPIGGYRHPDHIAIHQATVKAFELAGDPNFEPNDGQPFKPQKLYFHTLPHTWLRLSVRLMPLLGQNPRKFGKNKDIDLVSITEVRFPIHARVDYRPVSRIHAEASACHASQGGRRFISGPLGQLRRWIGSYDAYMRAYPDPQANMRPEKDLFSGVQ